MKAPLYRSCIVCSLAACCFLLPTRAAGQCEEKLVPDIEGWEENDFGFSVAVEGDALVVGDIRLRSNELNAIKRMPVRVTPR